MDRRPQLVATSRLLTHHAGPLIEKAHVTRGYHITQSHKLYFPIFCSSVGLCALIVRASFVSCYIVIWFTCCQKSELFLTEQTCHFYPSYNCTTGLYGWLKCSNLFIPYEMRNWCIYNLENRWRPLSRYLETPHFHRENTADFVQVSNRTGSIIQGDVFQQDGESWEVTNYYNLHIKTWTQWEC